MRMLSKAAPEERVGVMCLDKEGNVITPEEMCVIIFVFGTGLKRSFNHSERCERDTSSRGGENQDR